MYEKVKHEVTREWKKEKCRREEVIRFIKYEFGKHNFCQYITESSGITRPLNLPVLSHLINRGNTFFQLFSIVFNICYLISSNIAVLFSFLFGIKGIIKYLYLKSIAQDSLCLSLLHTESIWKLLKTFSIILSALILNSFYSLETSFIKVLPLCSSVYGSSPRWTA